MGFLRLALTSEFTAPNYPQLTDAKPRPSAATRRVHARNHVLLRTLGSTTMEDSLEVP